jgi:hypothetical protein
LVSDIKGGTQTEDFLAMVLTRIFGPKTDKVTGRWRKLHNEELRDLYSSPSIIRMIKSRRMRWAGHVRQMGEKRNVYRLLVQKPEGRRPLGRPKQSWVDNIKTDFGETGWDGVEWMVWLNIGQVESSCECNNEPSGSMKCWETIKWLQNWWPLE